MKCSSASYADPAVMPPTQRELQVTVVLGACEGGHNQGLLSRPGGAQAELLAEVNKHEADRNLALVLAEFRNYQQGILPAGPAARNLTDFFASIDSDLNTASSTAPKVQRNDRDILNLLTKRA